MTDRIERLTGPWQENARCRACGHRSLGGYGAFDTTCPECGSTSRWAWQLWNTVIERRIGLIPRRWQQRPGDKAFEPDLAPHAGSYVGWSSGFYSRLIENDRS